MLDQHVERTDGTEQTDGVTQRLVRELATHAPVHYDEATGADVCGYCLAPIAYSEHARDCLVHRAQQALVAQQAEAGEVLR